MNRPLQKLLLNITTITIAALAACAPSSKEEDVSSSTTFVLDGVFVPEDGNGEIEFQEDQHYRLYPEGCASEECEEQGTFELRGRDLILSIDGSPENQRTIPIEIEDTEDADSAQDDQANDPNDQATADGLRPQNLTDNRTKLISGRRVKLVRGVRLLKRRHVKLLGGTCTQSQITAAQASCRDVRCPSQGKKSRGINYCQKSSNGSASYSCACSGGSAASSAPTGCSRCQWSYRRCRANQISCPKMADCLGDFYNCSDSYQNCSTPQVKDFCTGWRP